MPESWVRQRIAPLPRFPLVQAPTALEPVDIELPDFNGRLFVKRDDCTGFALGGNKGRKLEFSIADALRQGATAVVTASGVQSNHVRQTAAAAAKAGLACHAIVSPALEQYPREHIESGNVLLDLLFGAALHLAPTPEDVDRVTGEVMDRIAGAGGRPYLIPLGASDGVGSLGYALCAAELRDQAEAQEVDPRLIFVPTGSGGTHGGLLAGARLDGWRVPVIGVSVSDPAPVKHEKVAASIAGVCSVLGAHNPVASEEIVVHDAYAGAGYAHPTEAANAWIVRLARETGLLLDPVYTGKAFAGMADLLAGPLGRKGGDVVFLHTGGTPALFSDPRLLVSVNRDAPELKPLYGATVE